MLVAAGPESLSKKRRHSKHRGRDSTNRKDDLSYVGIGRVGWRVPQSAEVALERRGSLFRGSFANDLYQNAFAAPSIELTVKDLFPRSEVELPAGDCNDHFPSHERSLQM